MNFWKKYLPFFLYTWVLNRIIRRIKKHAIKRVAKDYWPELGKTNATIPSQQLYAVFDAKPDFHWETMKNRILVPVERRGRRIVFSISRDIKLRHAFYKRFDFIEVNREESCFGDEDIYATIGKKVRTVTKEKLRKAMFLKRDKAVAVSLIPLMDPKSKSHIVHTCADGKQTFSLTTDRAVLDDTTPAEFQNLLETPNPKNIETRLHIVDAFYLTSGAEALGDPNVLAEELIKEASRCERAVLREFRQLCEKNEAAVPYFFVEALTDYCAATLFNVRDLNVLYSPDNEICDLLVTGYDSLMNEVNDVPLSNLLSEVPSPLNGFAQLHMNHDMEFPVSRLAVNFIESVNEDDDAPPWD